MAKYSITTLLVLLALLTALPPILPPASAQDGVTFTVTQSGTTINATVGDVVRLELDTLPLGYRWWLDEVNPDVLAMDGEPQYISDDGAPPGTSGTTVWVFNVIGPGESTLSLYFGDETGETVEQEFSMTVIATAPVDIPAPSVVLTEANSGEVITLSEGDVLQINLESTPGTGYEWTRADSISTMQTVADIVVYDVPAGSPAEGQLEPGDIVLEVDGIPVLSTSDLYDRAEVAAGMVVTLLIDRAGEQVEVELEASAPLSDASAFLYVVQVAEGMPAAEAGLQADDILVAMDGEPLVTFDQLLAYIEAHNEQEIVFTVQRDGESLDIPVTPRPDTTGAPRTGMYINVALPNAFGFIPVDRNLAFEEVVILYETPNLEQVGEPLFISPDTTMPGTSSIEQWHFQATAPGESTLALVYIRPWEEEPEAANYFELTVQVEE
ncbi:MAG: PDZ domain-containing protein [Chloroflexi bacterium]|nr:PDZ domain-containing protein [Chloroflexota bacterium]